jgi:hypothetical protein
MVQLGFIWFALLPYHMKISALLHYNHILFNAIFHWFPMVRKYLIIYTFILILFFFLSSFLWEENYATLKEKSMGHCREVCQENIEIIWVATQKLCWMDVKSAMNPYCRQNKSTVCFFFISCLRRSCMMPNFLSGQHQDLSVHHQTHLDDHTQLGDLALGQSGKKVADSTIRTLCWFNVLLADPNW